MLALRSASQLEPQWLTLRVSSCGKDLFDETGTLSQAKRTSPSDMTAALQLVRLARGLFGNQMSKTG
jgi:hypothetical protein